MASGSFSSFQLSQPGENMFIYPSPTGAGLNIQQDENIWGYSGLSLEESNYPHGGITGLALPVDHQNFGQDMQWQSLAEPLPHNFVESLQFPNYQPNDASPVRSQGEQSSLLYSRDVLLDNVNPGLLLSNSAGPYQDDDLASIQTNGKDSGMKEPYHYQSKEFAREESFEVTNVLRAQPSRSHRTLSSGGMRSGLKRSLSETFSEANGESSRTHNQVSFAIPPRKASEKTMGHHRRRSSPLKSRRSITGDSWSLHARRAVTVRIDVKGRALTENQLIVEEPQMETPQVDSQSRAGATEEDSSSDDEIYFEINRQPSFSVEKSKARLPQLAAPDLDDYEGGAFSRTLSKIAPNQLNVRNPPEEELVTMSATRKIISKAQRSSSSFSEQLPAVQVGFVGKAAPAQETSFFSMTTSRKLTANGDFRSSDTHHSRSQYVNFDHNINRLPANMTDTDSATSPSLDLHGSPIGQSTRCVCDSTETDARTMIQCDACEKWLHVKCTGLDPKHLPAVYICLHCIGYAPDSRRGSISKSKRSKREVASSPIDPGVHLFRQ
ncbi:MAG: hypothetical protein M1829_006935 [Trizodia sp. TS-e1964]|nr:MAG: hypothetical protein M1829_006935 [Trizodia sp. TS-e1964]